MFSPLRVICRFVTLIWYALQSEATDLVKEGFNEFSFKLHGHKHTFQTKSLQERDGWLIALQQTAEHAAGRREEMLGSSGYKDSIAQLGESRRAWRSTIDFVASSRVRS